MHPIMRSSLMRNRNKNTLLSKESQHEGRIYRSQQKNMDFDISSRLKQITVENSRIQYKYQNDLYRNLPLNSKFMNVSQSQKNQRVIKNNAKPGFQKTISGFNKQGKQIISGRFYQTTTNNFTIITNRPISKKQNRDKNIPFKQSQQKYALNHGQSQFPQDKSFRCIKLSSQTSKKELPQRPETSKGQRKRSKYNTSEDVDQQLMNQLIPQITEQQQDYGFSKKLNLNIDSKKYCLRQYRKRIHPMSAAQKKSKDVSSLIKLNSNTQKQKPSILKTTFQTSIDNDFLCLFANGKWNQQ